MTQESYRHYHSDPPPLPLRPAREGRQKTELNSAIGEKPPLRSPIPRPP